MCCWHQFATFSQGFLHLRSSRILVGNSFCCPVLVFAVRSHWPRGMSLKGFLLLQWFAIIGNLAWVLHSLMGCSHEAMRPWGCGVGRVFIADSVSASDLLRAGFLFLWGSFGWSCVSRSLSFLQIFHFVIWLCTVASGYSLCVAVSVVMSPFSTWIWLSLHFFFFLFNQFCLPFQVPDFSSYFNFFLIFTISSGVWYVIFRDPRDTLLLWLFGTGHLLLWTFLWVLLLLYSVSFDALWSSFISFKESLNFR